MTDRKNLKIKILEKALTIVPFENWSPELLEKSAQECGVDGSYGWRLFPGGPREAIQLWSHLLDQEMIHLLPSPESLRVRERVALAVKTRLSLLTPHREAARVTVQYLKRPSYLPEATRLVYKTVNEIWYYAGDTSTDYNFYTKRALLSWAYSRTFLYWLQDNSEDFADTWNFLNQRIEDILKIPQYFNFPWKRHG